MKLQNEMTATSCHLLMLSRVKVKIIFNFGLSLKVNKSLLHFVKNRCCLNLFIKVIYLYICLIFIYPGNFRIKYIYRFLSPFFFFSVKILLISSERTSPIRIFIVLYTITIREVLL